MAARPCDYDRRRYRQPQQMMYWTEVGPHIITTRALRLCPEHFDYLDEQISNQLTDVSDPGEVPDVCEHCGDARVFSVSVRTFRAKSVEQQFCGELCAACLSKLGNDLHVYNAEPLDPR